MDNKITTIKEVTYKPIGIVHSPYKEKVGTPIQGIFSPEKEATIELLPKYIEGLEGLEGFSHIYILYHFHLSEGYKLKVSPFLDDKPKGVFAIRGPNRPNSIGLSVVKLNKIEGNVLHISEIDVIDGTPVLDLKPYVPEFDFRPDARSGWVEGKVTGREERHKADSRFG